MEYVIRILTTEKNLLEKALEGWDDGHYPEAKKVRDKRLKEVNNAIEILSR